MRLFLAAELPEPVKQSLFLQTKKLREEFPYFRWIPAENYHITLFFFGNVDTGNEKRIIQQIDAAVFDVPPFRLYSGPIDLFIRDSIMIYLGFQKNKTIGDLVKKIKREMNIQNDLKFFPHLTLARYRIPSKQQYLVIKKKCSQYNVDIQFEIPQITLFDSVIENKKPIYKVVEKFPLLSD